MLARFPQPYPQPGICGAAGAGAPNVALLMQICVLCKGEAKNSIAAVHRPINSYSMKPVGFRK